MVRQTARSAMTSPNALSLMKIYSGKVRDLYEIDDKRLLMVADLACDL